MYGSLERSININTTIKSVVGASNHNNINTTLVPQYLPECGRVLHLVAGCVAECGSHAALLRNAGDYSALYAAHQATVSSTSNAAAASSNATARRRTITSLSSRYAAGGLYARYAR